MPWNGSGTFSRTNGVHTGPTVWDDDRQAGTKIVATRHDTHDQDLAAGINAALARNGENDMAGNLKPDASGSRDLGTVGKQWRALHGGINGQTAETSPAGDDELLIYDVSAGANRKMTRANFLKSPAVSDADAYAVAAADFSRTLLFTGAAAATWTLGAAATLGEGFSFSLHNTGTAVLTLDSNASEVIRTFGADRTTIRVYPGEAFALWCDGTRWHPIGRQREVLIQSLTASASSSLDFTTGLDDTEFAEFEFKILGIILATASEQLRIKVDTNGGSSFEAGASDYRYHGHALDDGAGTYVGFASTGTTSMPLTTPNAGHSNSDVVDGSVRYVRRTSSSKNMFIVDTIGIENTTGNLVRSSLGGAYATNTVSINAIRIAAGAGNLTSGRVALIGRRF